MLKKYLVTAIVFAATSIGGINGAFCAVPIFSSTDIFENSNEIQQVEIAPASTVNTNPTISFDNSASIKQETTLVDYTQIQNNNFRSAIQNLDGAEVGIREVLVDYKTKYGDAKTRYDASKAECNVLKKEIRAQEKKIKEIERAKKAISKNIVE